MNKQNAVNCFHQPHDLKLLYYVLTFVFLSEKSTCREAFHHCHCDTVMEKLGVI